MTARAARAGRQGPLGGHGAHGRQGGALVRGGLVVWLNDGPAAPSKTIIAFTILLLHPIHSELKCIVIGFENCFFDSQTLKSCLFRLDFCPKRSLLFPGKIITSHEGHKGHKGQCMKAFRGWLMKFNDEEISENLNLLFDHFQIRFVKSIQCVIAE